MRLITLFLVTLLSLSACREGAEAKSPCDGKQWNHPSERIECLYPHPPIGRWHAVYTKEFAEKYNLPLENVSKDLSPGVDYMEMDVQPFGDKGGVGCFVNMFVKKPHDIALYSGLYGEAEIPKERELARLIDIEKYRSRLKDVDSFESVSRDFDDKKSGFSVTTNAVYAEDVLDSYDYFSINRSCLHVTTNPEYFPDGHALFINKASVWRRYDLKYKHLEDVGRPKGEEIYQSQFFINIPYELISNVFKDVPIGGR